MNGMNVLAQRLFGGGVLDPELEKRLTDSQRQQMVNAGYLDAGLAMMAASGPSLQPVGFGQALAQGIGAGRQAYGQQAQALQAQQQAAERAALIATLAPEQQRLVQLLGNDGLKMYAEQQGRIELEREKAKSKDNRTALQKNLEAAGLKPGSPEYQDAINRATFMSKAPIVNNYPAQQYTPLEKAMGDRDADTLKAWRDEAVTAGSMLDQLQVLDQINNLQQGGKIGEAQAVIGQFFGSDAGANMQVWNAMSKDLVVQKAQALKGAMSDRDIALIDAALPNYGNDPRANKIVIEILMRASQRAIENFQAADAYTRKHKTLSGFQPMLRAAPPRVPVDAAKVNLDALSAEEIEAELQRRRGAR